MIGRRAAASWMAAAVIGLTATARADGPARVDGPASPLAEAPANGPAAPTASAISPGEPAATPLTLRPGKPLELSKEPSGGGSLGWKMAAVLLVLGGATLFARKRFQPPSIGDARLNIVRRTSVGFRSELVVVDVDGQRLLLGVTPSSIQMLATLDNEDAASTIQASSAGADERFAALLEAADRRSSPPHTEAASASQPARERREELPSNPDDVAGQARGLLALRGRR